MKRIKKLHLIALIMLSSSGYAQIHFEKDIGWGQILEKAKKEHKGIFLDCYATWCQPCKWMDNNVYQDKTVDVIYNAAFVCAKIQMDKTEKDDPYVKSLYTSAT